MYRNLSIKSLGLSGRQSEVIEAALSYRFKSLTLNIEEFAQEVQTFGLPHARRLIDSARIKIGTFALPLQDEQWEASDAEFRTLVERLPKYAELATQLGCTRATSSIPPASDMRPYHENFEVYRRRLGEVAQVLQAREICLGLEIQATTARRQGRAFQFIHALDALVQLTKMVSPDTVGVVVDLWQMRVGGQGLEELRKIPLERIVAVYLSDMPEEANLETIDESARLLPGETNVIDSAAVLTALSELGYGGPVTVRVASEHLPGKNRDEKIRLVSERLAKLWAEAGLDNSGKLSASAKS